MASADSSEDELATWMHFDFGGSKLSLRLNKMKTLQDRKTIYILGRGSCHSGPHPRMVDISPVGNTPRQCPAYRIEDSIVKGVIPENQLRRLGKIQKMALLSTWQAFQDCGIDLAQREISVAVGTGLGSMNETGRFLENLFISKENCPKPTCFSNSVHNSVASQIAIVFQCRGENHTFTQHTISFELAMKHSITLLHDHRADFSIVCGCDEVSSWLLEYGHSLRWWKREAAPLMPMEDTTTQGTIPGEGSASFLLCSQDPGSVRRPVIKIVALEVCLLDSKSTPESLTDFILTSLAANGIHIRDINQIMFGANAGGSDKIYHDIKKRMDRALGNVIPYETYKQYCGEFCTASAIGLAKTVDLLHHRFLQTRKHETCVIFNYSPEGYCSLYIIQSC